MPLEGDPNGYAAKDEIADYFQSYANRFELPIYLETEVTALKQSKQGFHLHTNQREYAAKNVIVATGPFQQPLIPQIADTLAKDIVQIHTAHYLNPSSLS
jgi:putative flavoprotein involved in K+ transport